MLTHGRLYISSSYWRIAMKKHKHLFKLWATSSLFPLLFSELTETKRLGFSYSFSAKDHRAVVLETAQMLLLKDIFRTVSQRVIEAWWNFFFLSISVLKIKYNQYLSFHLHSSLPWASQVAPCNFITPINQVIMCIQS